MNQPARPLHESVGRYVLHPPFARGGMATVHTARRVAGGAVGPLVAVKRLHAELVDDPDFVEMFHDEARIASRIHHPNVVSVLDVIASEREVLLVQEYVHGVPLSVLLKATIADRTPIPHDIVVAVVVGVLAGLHAAHEATDERGVALDVVHRDVSPQNVIVSVDGIPRLLDFGIAKATTCSHRTQEGVLKGKLAYMSPEQLRGEVLCRRADVYAAGVLLWELLANKRFHDGKSDLELVAAIAEGELPSVTGAVGDTFLDGDRYAGLVALEPVAMRAIASDADDRFPTAAAMLQALAAAYPAARAVEVAAWVKSVGAEYLERRDRALASNEESWRSSARIAAAPSSKPSGVQRAVTAPRSLVPMPMPTPAPASVLPTPSIVTLTGPAPSEEPRAELVRVLPWLVVAALLLVVGMLLGIVAERSRAHTLGALQRQLDGSAHLHRDDVGSRWQAATALSSGHMKHWSFTLHGFVREGPQAAASSTTATIPMTQTRIGRG
jgi:serine/threonine protein kinase